MPLQYLVALFIGLPVLELAVLLKLHGMVGLIPTIALVLLTGVAGALLVRRQGLSILFSIQREMAMGNLPTPQLLDGVMVLVAGAFLLTPGLITDTAGFLLLIPFVRGRIRAWLRETLAEKIRRGSMEIHVGRGP